MGPAPQSSRLRTIVHVDMDAFYASVEELDHPEYRGRPLIIGADPKGGHGRGVVSTANYVARQFGVISAQPVSQAFRLCPQGIFIPPRIQRYVQLSRQVMEILEGFSPVVEQVGIDEAFLDCTGTERLFGPSTKLGRRIKSAIRDGTELTASVGIAPNKYIAKVASDLEKPDGLTICAPGKEREFLAKLPIERLWGAGKKTVARLKTLGYWQIGDLGRASIEQVQRELGNWGEHFWRLANGLDDRPVQRGWRRKSISEETTFAVDISDEERIERALFEIAETLTHNMRQEGARGRTITLKIRLQGFETFTRSHTVADPTDETRLIRATALRLFRNFDRKDKAVRLIGIGVSNLRFADEPHKARSAQMDLFGELAARPAPGGDSDARSDPKDRKRDELFDRLKNRFGNHVKRGSLM